jgi:nitrogenase subunit NifH
MTELKNFFGDKLCRTTVPRNIRLAEAPSHGKAALVYDPRSKGAESYIKLAKEIIERQPPAVNPQPAETSGQTSGVGPQVSEQQITTEGTEEHRGDAAVEEIAPAAEMDKSA